MLQRWLQPGILPIGLDCGSSGAKALQLRRFRGALSVVGAARINLPDQIEDPIARAKALAQGVARRLDTSGFVGRQCVVAIDDRLVRTRSVRLPILSDIETDKAVRVDGSQRLGFDTPDAEIGWLRAGQVRQGDELREEVILAGASHHDVGVIVDALLEQNITPIAVEPAFLALARAIGRFYRRQDDQRHMRIVVDVGWTTSTVIALRGSSVSFVKPLEFGGQLLDDAAAQRLNLDSESIAALRRDRQRAATDDPSISIDPRIDRAIFDAVRPTIADLAHEISLCIRYLLVTFRGDRPQEILLVGGEAAEPRLAEVIQETTDVPTRLARPLEGIDLAQASFAGADRRGALNQWAVAAGLSFRGDAPASTAPSLIQRLASVRKPRSRAA